MQTLRDSSTPAPTTLLLLGLLVALLAALTAPAAGVAAPEGPEPSQLAFEPGAHDFGLQPVNSGASQASFQLRNDGSEAVQTENVWIAGSGAESFWIGYSDCSWRNMQPAETCTVQVYFGPRDAVEYEAELRVGVGSGSSSFAATLSGIGGRASFVPASNPFDFGSVAVGSAGTTREIEIANAGNMAGGVFIAVIAGGAIGSFQLLDENCTGVMLAPGATCTMQVRFQPLSEGVKKATLGLFGDSDGGTQVILTGVGTAPEPQAAAQEQSHSTAPGVATTTIVKKKVYRLVRPRAKSRKRGSQRRLRHQRRASIGQASRIP